MRYLEPIKDIVEDDLPKYGFWFLHTSWPFDVYTNGILYVFINKGEGVQGTGLQNFWCQVENLKTKDMELRLEDLANLSAHMSQYFEQDLD